MTRRLLVSIHDVSPRFEDQVDRLIALIERRLGPASFAMLVVPDHWGEAPLDPASRFADRLRTWAAAGVEMFVHGWFHRDTSDHRDTAARAKATLMTAGEGEFLGLDEAEAARRMTAGRALIEGIIGRPAAGFIAPAWLYGDGARAALAASGFALAEDHWRVWRPHDGVALTRGPVITWASRSRWRTASSLVVAAGARRLLTHASVVRVAVHPGDTTKGSIERSIDGLLATLVRTHRPSRYASLLTAATA